MVSKRWMPLLPLIVLACPLMFAWRWLAETYPSWDERSTLCWIDDRYLLLSRSVTNSFLTNHFKNNGQWLLDSQTGRLSRLRHGDPYLKNRRPLEGPTIEGLTPNGVFVWSTQSVDRETIEWFVTDLESAATRRQSDLPNRSHPLIGGRYLLADGYRRFRYFDLHEPQPIVHESDAFSQVLFTRSIPGHSNFFFLQPQFLHRLAEPTRSEPKWFEELRQLDLKTPEGSPVEAAMLVLCQMTSTGPQEIAHWPILYPHFQRTKTSFMADGPYIFCHSLDGNALQVHDANTGKMTAKITLSESFESQPDLGWKANRHAIRIRGSLDALDPATGEKLPASIASREILDHHEDLYLTATTKKTWRSNYEFQVCRNPTGELVTTIRSPISHLPLATDNGKTVRLSADGKQVLIATSDERAMVYDSMTGKLVRSVSVQRWLYVGAALILLASTAWLVAWWRVGQATGIPRWILLGSVSAVLLTILLMRCRLHGYPVSMGRLAFQTSVALLVAWTIEALQYLVRPGSSQARRVLVVIAIALPITIFTQLCCLEVSHALVVLFWITISMTAAGWFLFLRICGDLPARDRSKAVLDSFTLSEFMSFTAFAALLISVLARVDWMNENYLLEQSTSIVGSTVLFALFAIMLRYWPLARVGTIVIATGIALFQLSESYPTTPDGLSWLVCTALVPLALFSYFRVEERVVL